MSCFKTLCKTLEAAFSAAPLSEEELDYSSATLIIAGLLQLHTRAPRYATYQARLKSYPDGPNECKKPMAISMTAPIRNQSNSFHEDEVSIESDSLRSSSAIYPSPDELASAGFFHTGSGDETVCPACGLGLRDWQATDLPEACHLAYSSVPVTSPDGGDDFQYTGGQFIFPILPSLPCLYSIVRRLLVSELPLARKSLIPAGPVNSVCTLPGITTRPNKPTGLLSDSPEACRQFASLADRLRSIARIMSAPSRQPEGWPVENSRALGHSDDLIVLALWRLQSEAAGTTLSCPSISALRLDPQATTDLLRAVLRIQEGFTCVSDDVFQLIDPQRDDEHETRDAPTRPNERLSFSESPGDAEEEVATLSRCRFQRIPSGSDLPEGSASDQLTEDTSSLHAPISLDSNEYPVPRVKLPQFHQFLCWWSERWPLNPC